MTWSDSLFAGEARVIEEIEAHPTWESSLLKRLRAGDPDAIGLAYDAYHEQVRRLARRMVGDNTVAEDLLQETFLALSPSLGRFDGRGSLLSFLLGIVVNQARNHLRAATRRRKLLSEVERSQASPAGGPLTPEQAAEQRQLADMLYDALDHLPLAQRAAFVLCEIEGRSSAEAAAILQTPEPTLRSRLFHARRGLRAHLTERGIK